MNLFVVIQTIFHSQKFFFMSFKAQSPKRPNSLSPSWRIKELKNKTQNTYLNPFYTVSNYYDSNIIQ